MEPNQNFPLLPKHCIWSTKWQNPLHYLVLLKDSRFHHSGWFSLLCFLNKYPLIMCNTESIGRAKPKFSMVAKGLRIVHRSKNSITLSCPAQGFPLPAFRLELSFFIEFLNFFPDFRTNWWGKTKIFIVH